MEFVYLTNALQIFVENFQMAVLLYFLLLGWVAGEWFPINDNLAHNQEWQDHKTKYDLRFAPEEEQERFHIFLENLELIRKHTLTTESDHVVGLGPFTHLSRSEFAKRNKLRHDHAPTSRRSYHRTQTQLPAVVDWVNQGKLSPVKDQNNCGSCWSFSSTAAVEACIAIRDNIKPVELSTENLVDCVPDTGCGTGGWPDDALDWAKTHGLASAIAYKDTSSHSGRKAKCHDIQPRSHITSHYHLSGDYEGLMEAVSKGPVVVLIDTDGDKEHAGFEHYRSGVITHCAKRDHLKQTDLDHAVLIVGYGTTAKGVDYWLVRNSWGPHWGEKGYFRIQRLSGQGLCGINMYAAYPTC